MATTDHDPATAVLHPVTNEDITAKSVDSKDHSHDALDGKENLDLSSNVSVQKDSIVHPEKVISDGAARAAVESSPSPSPPASVDTSKAEDDNIKSLSSPDAPVDTITKGLPDTDTTIIPAPAGEATVAPVDTTLEPVTSSQDKMEPIEITKGEPIAPSVESSAVEPVISSASHVDNVSAATSTLTETPAHKVEVLSNESDDVPKEAPISLPSSGESDKTTSELKSEAGADLLAYVPEPSIISKADAKHDNLSIGTILPSEDATPLDRPSSDHSAATEVAPKDETEPTPEEPSVVGKDAEIVLQGGTTSASPVVVPVPDVESSSQSTEVKEAHAHGDQESSKDKPVVKEESVAVDAHAPAVEEIVAVVEPTPVEEKPAAVTEPVVVDEVTLAIAEPAVAKEEVQPVIKEHSEGDTQKGELRTEEAVATIVESGTSKAPQEEKHEVEVQAPVAAVNAETPAVEKVIDVDSNVSLDVNSAQDGKAVVEVEDKPSAVEEQHTDKSQPDHMATPKVEESTVGSVQEELLHVTLETVVPVDTPTGETSTSIHEPHATPSHLSTVDAIKDEVPVVAEVESAIEHDVTPSKVQQLAVNSEVDHNVQPTVKRDEPTSEETLTTAAPAAPTEITQKSTSAEEVIPSHKEVVEAQKSSVLESSPSPQETLSHVKEEALVAHDNVGVEEPPKEPVKSVVEKDSQAPIEEAKPPAIVEETTPSAQTEKQHDAPLPVAEDLAPVHEERSKVTEVIPVEEKPALEAEIMAFEQEAPALIEAQNKQLEVPGEDLADEKPLFETDSAVISKEAPVVSAKDEPAAASDEVSSPETRSAVEAEQSSQSAVESHAKVLATSNEIPVQGKPDSLQDTIAVNETKASPQIVSPETRTTESEVTEPVVKPQTPILGVTHSANGVEHAEEPVAPLEDLIAVGPAAVNEGIALSGKQNVEKELPTADANAPSVEEKQLAMPVEESIQIQAHDVPIIDPSPVDKIDEPSTLVTSETATAPSSIEPTNSSEPLTSPPSAETLISVSNQATLHPSLGQEPTDVPSSTIKVEEPIISEEHSTTPEIEEELADISVIADDTPAVENTTSQHVSAPTSSSEEQVNATANIVEEAPATVHASEEKSVVAPANQPLEVVPVTSIDDKQIPSIKIVLPESADEEEQDVRYTPDPSPIMFTPSTADTSPIRSPMADLPVNIRIIDSDDLTSPVTADLETFEKEVHVFNSESILVSDEEEKESDSLSNAGSEIERPKSPWTPSFQVTTIGRGVSPSTDEEVLESVESSSSVLPLVTEAEDKAETGDAVADESQAVPQAGAEEVTSSSAHVDEVAPQLTIDTSASPSLEPRPWTPSYSVHSQGSPLQVSADPEPEEPTIKPISESSKGEEPELADMEFAPNVEDTAISKDIHVAGQDPAPKDAAVQETTQVPTAVKDLHVNGTADTVLQHPGAPSSEDLDLVSDDKLSLAAPVDFSLSITNENPDITEALEISAIPNTVAYDALVNDIIPPFLATKDVVEQNTYAPALHEQSSPSLEVTLDHETDEFVETSFIKDEPNGPHLSPQDGPDQERPKSPSWVPSYSVSSQGSPLLEKVDLAPEDLPSEALPSDNASFIVNEPLPTPEVKETAPTISITQENVSAPEEDDDATDEDVEVPTGTFITPLLDVHGSSSDETTTPLIISVNDGTDVTSQVHSEEQTPEQDRPKSPWTPSYSVTTQGSKLPTDEELDDSEPLTRRTIDESHDDDSELTPIAEVGENAWVAAPEQADANIEKEKSSETSELPSSIEVSKEVSSDSVIGVDKPTESREQELVSKEVFPMVKHDEEQKISNRPVVSRLAPVDENISSSIDTLTSLDTITDATPVSPRSRLESTTSSRFFPGGWFSTSAKVPDEGRTSLEIARGEFIASKATPSDDVDSSSVSDGSLSSEDSDDEDQKSKKSKWCVVM